MYLFVHSVMNPVEMSGDAFIQREANAVQRRPEADQAHHEPLTVLVFTA